jgi:phage tail tube protein FII
MKPVLRQYEIRIDWGFDDVETEFVWGYDAEDELANLLNEYTPAERSEIRSAKIRNYHPEPWLDIDWKSLVED